jgi:hypothetical protein
MMDTSSSSSSMFGQVIIVGDDFIALQDLV